MPPSPPASIPAPERFLGWLERTLKERKNPDGAFQKISRSFRKSLTVATVAYFLCLVVLLILINWWGERNWLLSILLFVPAVIWIVPLILLTPLHLIFRPRLCWITLVALLLVAFVFLDFHWAFARDQSKAGLLLLSNNVGGRKIGPFLEFLEKEDPDVVALQDAWRVVGDFARKYPERFFFHEGEYVLLSKIPIRKSGLLSLKFRGRPIGSWHELEYSGQSIMIYNIHMPTPRPEFEKLRGRGFVAELVGGKGIYSKETRNAYKEFTQSRIQLIRELVELLEKEERPFLIAGDFNMPANGYLRDLFKFTDAFGAKGRGYGFTFPGGNKSAASLFGPWLRLDYLFAGKNWKPLSCRVEPRQPAEHRAVIARFELQTPHKP